MRPLRRTRFFLIAVAAASSILADSGAAGAGDNPVVDTRRSGTATILTNEQLQVVPAGRNLYEVLQLAPQMNLKTDVDSSGNPKRAWFGNDQWNIQGSVTRYRKFEGSYELRKDRVAFPSGHTGDVRMSVHTLPNPRVNFRISNLRYQAARLPEEVLTYIPVMTTLTPPDAGTPADSGAPAGPAPGDTTPGFGGLQSLGGPIIRNGGRFNGFFQAREHPQEECARHTIKGVALCVLGTGPTSANVYGTTENWFRFRRLGPPKPNLTWEDGECDGDGCDCPGSFFGQPVRARLEAFRAPSNTELFADASLYLNEGRPNQSVIPFDYRATYVFQPGSTGTTSPFPSVPNVPVPAPQPPVPTDVVFRGPYDFLKIGNGTLIDAEFSVPYHGENHDKHSVVYGGRRYFLCQFDNHRSQLRAFDTTPERFSAQKTTSPNRGWEWKPLQCDSTGCRAEGNFYGTPFRAWTPELPQVSPDLSFRGKLNIELNNSNDPVLYNATGRIRYSF